MKKRNLIVGIILLTISIILIVFGLLTGPKGPMYVGNKALSIILYSLSVITILIGFNLTINQFKIISLKEMVLISIQAAIAVLLYYFAKLKLPLTPSWLDFQVSEVPALITSFIYGPMAGIIVLVIRFIVKLPMTITVGVGEMADLVLGVALVLITGLIYKKHRTLKGALISSLIGIVASTILACLLNWLVLIPAYITIAGFPIQGLVAGMSYIKGINELNFMPYYIFLGVLPFNIIRYLAVFIFTFILYKNTKRLFVRLTN